MDLILLAIVSRFLWLSVTLPLSTDVKVEKLGLDLWREVFSHGQLYSAMARVPDSENVLILNEADFSTSTTNIVWEELLL
jgi:hypothetical protein